MRFITERTICLSILLRTGRVLQILILGRRSVDLLIYLRSLFGSKAMLGAEEDKFVPK